MWALFEGQGPASWQKSEEACKARLSHSGQACLQTLAHRAILPSGLPWVLLLRQACRASPTGIFWCAEAGLPCGHLVYRGSPALSALGLQRRAYLVATLSAKADLPCVPHKHLLSADAAIHLGTSSAERACLEYPQATCLCGCGRTLPTS